jgi:hypothetical protein
VAVDGDTIVIELQQTHPDADTFPRDPVFGARVLFSGPLEYMTEHRALAKSST